MPALGPRHTLVHRKNVGGIITLPPVPVGIAQTSDIQAREDRPRTGLRHTRPSELRGPSNPRKSNGVAVPAIESQRPVVNKSRRENIVLAEASDILLRVGGAAVTDGARPASGGAGDR